MVIAIEPQAPAKPALGADCNGCGVCCLWQPCPVGMVVSLRRQGACAALLWSPQESRYRCGAVQTPQAVLRSRWPRALQWLVPLVAWMLQRWALRWIAAGQGCDCSLQVAPAPSATIKPVPPLKRNV